MKTILSGFLLTLTLLLPGAEQSTGSARLKFTDSGFAAVGNSRGFQFQPDAEKKGIVFSWEENHPAWMEGEFRPSVPLPRLEKADFQLTVDVPDAAFAATFALRLKDAAGEIFQLPGVSLVAGRAGQRRLDFRFDPEAKNECWGGDGKIDWPLELFGVSMAFAPGTRGGSIRLDSIRHPAAGGALGQLKTELETGDELSLLPENGALSLKLTNAGGEPVAFKADITAEDYSGRSLFRQTLELTLAPEEIRSFPVADPPELLGVRILSCELSTSSETAPSVRKFYYGRMIPAGPAKSGNPEFLFGIHDHTAIDRWELRIRAAALCGAKVIRGAGLSWGMIQQTPNTWNFKESDALVDLITSNGMELQMILAFTPLWGIAPGHKFYPEPTRPDYQLPDLAAYENYAATMAKRYRGKVRLFEIWNEPDIVFADFSTADYLKLQAAGFRGVKKANPEAIIMNGGIALMTPSAGKETIQDEIMASIGQSCDWYAVHGHGPFPEYVDTVNRVLELRRKHGNKGKWYSNETAASAAGGMEKEQAAILYKKLLYAWMNGAAGYTWYDLVNDGFDPFNHEHNFGLLTRDFMPKPAFFVYNMLARRFGEASFAGRSNDGNAFLAALFRVPGGMLLPLWRESGDASPVLLLETDAASAEAIDLMDNARPLELRNGKLLIPAGLTPKTIRLAGATRAKYAGTPLTYSGLLIPGSKAVLMLELHNPSDAPEEYTLHFGTEELRVRLAAKESARRELAAAISGPTAPELRWQIGGAQGSVTPELAVAIAVPAKKSGPDLRLDSSRQRVEIHPHDPNLLHMTWHGPGDLSAAATLTLKDEKLIAEIEVTDDIHSQAFDGGEIYKGDSVQIGLALPGGEAALLFGAALSDSGKAMTHIWHLSEGKPAQDIPVHIVREGSRTIYRLKIPLSLTGLNADTARRGFRFNLLVNDNDGKGRKGWLELAPGIGMGLDVRTFPLLLME